MKKAGMAGKFAEESVPGEAALEAISLHCALCLQNRAAI
jgi:hypothetical protein